MCNEFRHIIVNGIVSEDHIMEILAHAKKNWQEYSPGYDSTHRGGTFSMDKNFTFVFDTIL
jgi:hypothetical protein